MNVLCVMWLILLNIIYLFVNLLPYFCQNWNNGGMKKFNCPIVLTVKQLIFDLYIYITYLAAFFMTFCERKKYMSIDTI